MIAEHAYGIDSYDDVAQFAARLVEGKRTAGLPEHAKQLGITHMTDQEADAQVIRIDLVTRRLGPDVRVAQTDHQRAGKQDGAGNH